MVKAEIRRNTSRFIELDFLRVLAIGYIVIHHVDDYASNLFCSKPDIIITYISLGILVYISGFLLSTHYPSVSNSKELALFIKKRIFRIYPLYLVALLLFFASSVTSVDVKTWMLNALPVVNMLFSPFVVSPILTLWFVSLIFFYYLLFAVCIYRHDLLRTVIFFCTIFVVLTGTNLSVGVVDKRLIIYLPLFLLGIIVARCQAVSELSKNKALIFILILICSLSSYIFLFIPRVSSDTCCSWVLCCRLYFLF